jgi:hypothetical protein
MHDTQSCREDPPGQRLALEDGIMPEALGESS